MTRQGTPRRGFHGVVRHATSLRGCWTVCAKASVGVRAEGLAHTTCQAFLSGISDLFKRAAYLAPSLRVHFARKVAGNLLNALVRGDTGRCGS